MKTTFDVRVIVRSKGKIFRDEVVSVEAENEVIASAIASRHFNQLALSPTVSVVTDPRARDVGQRFRSITNQFTSEGIHEGDIVEIAWIWDDSFRTYKTYQLKNLRTKQTVSGDWTLSGDYWEPVHS